MAKVKDQVLPGSDVSYIDSTGITHYDADLIRHIMPNAYPLPTLNPTGVARETARNKRPSHQGPGSPDQSIQRQCFRACASRWNNIYTTCPEYCDVKPTTSKEKVFEAKGSQGVMCSYYDLYMSCCMSGCNRSTGAISRDEECFLCPQPDPDTPDGDPDACKECIPSIEYTSQQMSGGESQDLTYTPDDACPDAPPCEPEDITWEITVGGGSFNNDPDISPDPVTTTSGFSPTYYAPEDNTNCENNPTIEMTDCRGYKSIISLAVNTSSGGWSFIMDAVGDMFEPCAYQLGANPPIIGPVYWYTRDWYTCSGEYSKSDGKSFCIIDSGCELPPTHPYTEGPVCNPDKVDIRTEAQKEAGCCPADFI